MENGGWQSVVAETPATQSLKPEMDRLERLAARTKSRPYDADVWNQYMSEALSRGDPPTVREAYEALLQQFPTSATHWIAYAEYEQKQKEFDRVEQIFGRCLQKIVSVDLWKFYLDYIIKTHSISRDPDAQATISTAFEFVISNIGFDLNSSAVWEDYLSWISRSEAKSNYEEQQKMDKMRRIFHQAILIPQVRIEQIWKDYDSFENGLNKMTAKKFMSERSAGYMTARSALRELRNLKEPIDKLASSFLARPPTWSENECKLLAHWKRYIAWEKSNPLGIDDQATLVARIIYAYKECLLSMRFYPEIWADAASFLSAEGRDEEAEAFLKNGIETLPTWCVSLLTPSLLLNFSLAELYEGKKKDFKEIQPIFDQLIAKLEDKVIFVNEKYDVQREELLQKLKDARIEIQEQDQPDQPDDEADWDGETREREREKEREIEREVETKVESKRKDELDLLKAAITNSFIVYMRIARRQVCFQCHVQSEKAARQVFGMARKSSNITYQVFVYSALMEYHCSKDATIAGKVFELALKNFLSDPPQASQVVLDYLDFLFHINDDINARAVFERAVTTLPVEYQDEIWKKLIHYETNFGEYALIKKVEKRYTDTIAGPVEVATTLQTISDHFSFANLSYISNVELGLSAIKEFGDKLPKITLTTSAKKTINKSRITQNLDSVNPERFPRPDFSKWAVFKADPSLKVDPVVDPNITALKNSSVSGSADSSPAGPLVPPAVAEFMKQLPSPHEFTGPILPADEIIKLLLSINVPLPSQTLTWVPIEDYGGGPDRGSFRRDDRSRPGPYDRRTDDRRRPGGGRRR